MVLTYGIAPEFRGGVHLFIYLKPPYVIGSVPNLSGHHAIAYRWCLLPRGRQHRASKPQGSSERVLPWQVTMDQLTCASLSHTHYWYEEGMLKYCYFVHRWGTSLFIPPPGSRVRRLGWSQYMHECIGASQGYHGVYRAAQTVLSRSV